MTALAAPPPVPAPGSTPRSSSPSTRPGDEPSTMVDWAHEFAEQLLASASQTEKNRTAPVDVVESLRDAGLFSMTLPRELGGAETDPATVMSVVDEISYADPSVGWTLLIGQSSGFLGWADFATGHRVVDVTPDPIVACALAPMGVGEVVAAETTDADDAETTYRISGRWSINSGCRHADWFIAAFAIKKEGVETVMWGEDAVRMAIMPASKVKILPTWHVMGLRGTGSDDVIIDGVEVPASMTFSPFFDAAEHQGPLYRLSYFAFLMMMMGGFSTGVARRALDEIRALSDSGTAVDLADTDTQVEMWRRDNELRAAKLLLSDAVSTVWQEACTDGSATATSRARFAGAVQNSQHAAEAAVDFAYRAAGARALRDEHPLQRCWRDIHAAGSHIAFSLVAERRMARAVYTGDESMNYMI